MEKTRIQKFAEDYADNWTGGFRHIAYKAYINGYNQCVEDDIQQDMDEYQKKLSESYSLLKEQHWNLKCLVKSLRQDIYYLQNPSNQEKLDKYIELKEEFSKKEVHY